MDEDLYDEFGNYIGPENEDEELDEIPQVPSPSVAQVPGFEAEMEEEDLEDVERVEKMALNLAEPQNAVVLHEDKQYYPSAEEVYGPEVDVVVQEQDTQPLTQPIIDPIRQKRVAIETSNVPDTVYKKEFLYDLLSQTDDVRTFIIAGHLHHGKTALLDLLVYYTHPGTKSPKRRSLRYTDTHYLERQRVMSIKSTPLTLAVQNMQGKSYAFQCLDTPGHVDFVDEIASPMAVADGVVIVVDVIEGVMINTTRAIKHAIIHDMPIVLVLNKVDRLVLELRLPPNDAYHKLRHVIDEVNDSICQISTNAKHRVSPELGNVCFASFDLGYCFTLASFAKLYLDKNGRIDLDDFSRRLWGDIYFDKDTRKFTKSSTGMRSFVYFILEPLYKLHTLSISDEQEKLKRQLRSLNIFLKPKDFLLEPKPFLQLVCASFFGFPTGLVDSIVQNIPSPRENASRKANQYYTGPLNSSIGKSLTTMNREESTMIAHITKLYNTVDANSFYALARIYAGKVRKGQKVQVLGENYSIEDEEDMAKAYIEEICLPGGRYRIPIEEATAGMLVLLAGVDNSISKTATIVSDGVQDDLYIFRPIAHMSESVFKVAVEPYNPSELPKMLDGLRKINKSYPLAITKVEESGEHTIFGTAELYMDCLLYDLRVLYSEIEIRVSDPVARFCETVVDVSSLKCFAETPNRKNRLSMIVEPLEKGIASDIENGHVKINWPQKQISEYFQREYDWDLLASRSVWAFGPDDRGTNILRDDTLEMDVDKKTLGQVKEFIKQGFQWGTREGPLCDETIRNANFRIMDAVLAQEPIYRGGGQIIPVARRVCYSSFLTASPRLMEPVYTVEVHTPADCLPVIYDLLMRRRGHVLQDVPRPGSPLYLIKALIPVIDSCGFETDLRVHTQGQAMCQQVFDHWEIVPGDPLDKSVKPRPLETARGPELARDFLVKTRRRKGLAEDVAITRYFDQEMIDSLKDTDIVLSL
ncbi:GTPase Cwf10 [Schizosaccharomyces octosporus yFS286]|uniref:GTPase Cwf10 n=1 Tax=Schizosaccharomyces octosporus (strain yFS286) TaxID=483514 RepID=S9QY82_SCHOY|nr:GTPase Cwf10 [Schizosaccharomyces octosporus yFS286]EPX71260.1 GTPase Cwf10 [Schizosaccharomyces octosporus yFS286]